MASASTTETFPCTINELYSVIADFNRYPDFLTEVKNCSVVEVKPGGRVVEFDVALIKSFKYRILVKEDAPRSLSWTLDSGDLFKTNVGSWELTEQDGQTLAKYSVEATFKVFMPGAIAKALVTVNLPNMMRAYQARVKSLLTKKA